MFKNSLTFEAEILKMLKNIQSQPRLNVPIKKSIFLGIILIGFYITILAHNDHLSLLNK